MNPVISQTTQCYIQRANGLRVHNGFTLQVVFRLMEEDDCCERMAVILTITKEIIAGIVMHFTDKHICVSVCLCIEV